MPQHPNTTRKQTQAKNKKSQKTKFLAFLAIYERCVMFTEKFGAGKRSRTVDLNLGKVALYQLSYSRLFTEVFDYTSENSAWLNCSVKIL